MDRRYHARERNPATIPRAHPFIPPPGSPTTPRAKWSRCGAECGSVGRACLYGAEKPGAAIPTRVRHPGAARDFSARVTFCAVTYSVCTAHVCTATLLFGHRKILHPPVAMVSAAKQQQQSGMPDRAGRSTVVSQVVCKPQK